MQPTKATEQSALFSSLIYLKINKTIYENISGTLEASTLDKSFVFNLSDENGLIELPNSGLLSLRYGPIRIEVRLFDNIDPADITVNYMATEDMSLAHINLTNFKINIDKANPDNNYIQFGNLYVAK